MRRCTAGAEEVERAWVDKSAGEEWRVCGRGKEAAGETGEETGRERVEVRECWGREKTRREEEEEEG